MVVVFMPKTPSSRYALGLGDKNQLMIPDEMSLFVKKGATFLEFCLDKSEMFK